MEISSIQILILTCAFKLGPFPVSYGDPEDIGFLIAHNFLADIPFTSNFPNKFLYITEKGETALLQYLKL